MGQGRDSILQRPLGPVGRWLARVPRYLYRLGLGWLLGSRMVLLEHTGRKSGRPRSTVLEVIRHDGSSLDVVAAWGPESDWFLNVVKRPSVMVSTGRLRSVPARAVVLERNEAAEVFSRYVTDHPVAARALGKTLGLDFDQPDLMAKGMPVVRLILAA